MRKILAIGWKDLRLVLRDRAALVLMLAAPFALTLALGFVAGRFSGADQTNGLSDIPVLLVNEDDGVFGQALLDVFKRPDLAGLLAPTASTDAAAARRTVEADEAAAAVIIPPGFTASLLPNFAAGASAPAAVAVEVYASPSRPVSAGVIQTIVARYLSQVQAGLVTTQVTVAELLASGRLAPQDAQARGAALAQRLLADPNPPSLITLSSTAAAAGSATSVDILATFAPAMAMFFLMYTVAYGGRSLLAERRAGTLPRLLSTPTAQVQVLAGKVFGIFLTGAAQLGVLVLASSLLFGLRWGDPLAVAALIAAVAAAATGWGLLLAAFARSPEQVGSLGSALMLLFGVLSGSFVPSAGFPGWLRALGQITPNAWGLQGFAALARGATLSGLLLPLVALTAMAVVLFGAAALLFRRTSLNRAA
jgi:ABC-2 type transport system permease protein